MILSLDDPCWESLYPGAANPLRAAEAGVGAGAIPDAVWTDLAWMYCNQGSVYLRSYAAVPHLARLSRVATPEDRFGLLRLVAGIERGRSRDAEAPLPPEWEPGYRRAIAEARAALAVCVAEPAADLKRALRLTEILLALNGFAEAGFWAGRLDDWAECPKCGTALLEPRRAEAEPGATPDPGRR